MITIAKIRADMYVNGRHYAQPLLAAMEDRAAEDPAYAEVLGLWLVEGGTVRLRDDLCLRFKDADFITDLLEHDHFYPWNDCWMAIDSARLHVRIAEDERSGRLVDL